MTRWVRIFLRQLKLLFAITSGVNPFLKFDSPLKWFGTYSYVFFHILSSMNFFNNSEFFMKPSFESMSFSFKASENFWKVSWASLSLTVSDSSGTPLISSVASLNSSKSNLFISCFPRSRYVCYGNIEKPDLKKRFEVDRFEPKFYFTIFGISCTVSINLVSRIQYPYY